MIRKQLGESRWFLGLGSAALFGLGWLSSFIACRIERQFLKVTGSDAERFEQFTRPMGGAAMDFSSLSFQVMSLESPVRHDRDLRLGDLAGECGGGGRDRARHARHHAFAPVSRPEYLGSQIIGALLGLVLLASALVVGNRIGGLYNPVKDTPPLLSLVKPAANLAAGRGCRLWLLAAICREGRRPLAAQPDCRVGHDCELRRGGRIRVPNALGLGVGGPLLGVQGVRPGRGCRHRRALAPHAAGLGAVAATGVLLSFILFQRRDLPSNS